MDVACLQQAKCIPLPFHSSTRLPRVSVLVRNNRRNASSYPVKNLCSASNFDTLVAAGSIREDKKLKAGIGSKKEQEEQQWDVKSWMHRNGLPPCKILLKDGPSHVPNHRPIHYVAASEDLQVNFCTNYLLAFQFFFVFLPSYNTSSFLSWPTLAVSIFFLSVVVGWGYCLFCSKFVGGDTGESFGERDCGYGN